MPAKPKMPETLGPQSPRTAKLHHDVLPARREPLAAGRRNRAATRRTAARARWRTPRPSGASSARLPSVPPPWPMSACHHRDLRGSQRPRVPARQRRDRGHGRPVVTMTTLGLSTIRRPRLPPRRSPGRGCESPGREFASRCRTRRPRGGRCSRRPTCRGSWRRCCRHRTAQSGS